MSDRIYNFSGKQTMLPPEVTERLHREMTEGTESGIPLLEMGGFPDYAGQLAEETEKKLRELLAIPASYKVLFMPGGATVQHSAIPINLLSEHRAADFVITGRESKAAYLEAKKFGDMAIAASSAGATPAFSTIPEIHKSDIRPDADYVHICYNNLAFGTRFIGVPDTGSIPIVADMSTSFLAEPVDITKFGLIFAALRGNVGVGGLTAVIVRDDLVRGGQSDVPEFLRYASEASHAGKRTGDIFSLYTVKLVLDYIEGIGGLEAVKRKNEFKASLLYDYLDVQSYYTAPADRKYRSMTTIPFITGNAKLDALFIEEAKAAGLYNVGGHPSVGGLGVALTTAMPIEGVHRLIDFMNTFASQHQKVFV